MATKEVLDKVEETIDLTEQTLDKIEEHRDILVPAVIVAGSVGLVLGATVGFIFAKKRLESKYDKIVKQEIEEAKQFYGALHKKEYDTPSDAAEALVPEKVREAADALRSYKGEAEEESETVVTEVEERVNIFERAQSNSEWDQAKEEEYRATLENDQPYIISEEEFMTNENEYRQLQFTYYEGDQVLADEQDKAIDLIDQTVGEANLERFGHGAGSSNVLFVQNDRLSMQFEIAKSEGKYAHEVLGFEHADLPIHRKVPRFRGDDG